MDYILQGNTQAKKARIMERQTLSRSFWSFHRYTFQSSHRMLDKTSEPTSDPLALSCCYFLLRFASSMQ